jgi:hypothetical protein
MLTETTRRIDGSDQLTSDDEAKGRGGRPAGFSTVEALDVHHPQFVLYRVA